ncbi:MAG: hypothetical protein GX053_15390 [Tissierella sp.]|nr:hypothetical protein [Tissierella sp.]
MTNKKNEESVAKKFLLDDEKAENYYKSYQASIQNILNSPFLYMNPFLKNQILQNINQNPVKLKKEQIEEIISNPKQNEKEIRQLSHFFYGYLLHYRRVIEYFAKLLTFDYQISPLDVKINNDEDKRTFKKNYEKAINYAEKFNFKQIFPEIMKGVLLEDAKFYYLRENKDYIVFQEMPSDWCLIVGRTELGYKYAFNMSYFLQSGANVYEYPPEFQDYFEEYRRSKEFKGSYPFWIELDPSVAPVFKFDDSHATILPPFMGSFVDGLDISDFKNLIKEDTLMKTIKLLVNEIPLWNDPKVHTQNPFKIDAQTAAFWNTMIQQSLPQMARSVTSPFKTEVYDFSDTASKDSLIGYAEDSYYRTIGTSPILFGEKVTTATAIRASQTVDESFVSHMYKQFERFVNYHMSKLSGKYKFKIKFEGTIWDKQERFEKALKSANVGMPVSALASANGYSPKEFMSIVEMENILDIKSKLMPLMTSYTMSDNNSGRPESNDEELTESGEKTRDLETNDR